MLLLLFLYNYSRILRIGLNSPQNSRCAIKYAILVREVCVLFSFLRSHGLVASLEGFWGDLIDKAFSAESLGSLWLLDMGWVSGIAGVSVGSLIVVYIGR